jgi:tRNA (guanine37-N1)-methyltransferase
VLRIQIISLFPEALSDYLRTGLLARAQTEGALSVSTIQLRDFAINTHGQIDDSAYGGGAGMVLRPESGVAALERAKEQDPAAIRILFSPRGKPLQQKQIKEFATLAQRPEGLGLILLSPRYEGVDQRIADNWIDLELSIGDYILMGGELPSLVLTEAITRLLPGVLNNPESTSTESFEGNLLEYPQYTKPREFRGLEVPEILISGDHQKIAKWRQDAALNETIERRPDLIPRPQKPRGEFSLALIHHPVIDKSGDIISSSITNLDLHDISRSSKTYGVDKFYVAHWNRIQRSLTEKITTHWITGYGLHYNPNRGEALELISLVSDFDDIILDIETRTGMLPKIIVTDARASDATISFDYLKKELLLSSTPHLLVLGTAWGLAPEIFNRADYRLDPINGPTDYNHLSVRAAAAIMLDRLMG